jgi:hypothetical protein
MRCSSCHYLMSRRNQCGWLGDVPPQPGGTHCNFVPLEQFRLPEGLVIAESLRVVPEAELAAENAAHSDAAGGGSWSGY